MNKRQLITESDVRAAAQGGQSVMRLATNAIITPLAIDAAQGMGVRFEFVQPDAVASGSVSAVLAVSKAGFVIKRAALDALKARNIAFTELRDTGNDAVQLSVDAVKAVVGGGATLGIIIDDTGMLPCMIANRFSGIRAVYAGETRQAKIARSRFDANVLTLGAEFLTAQRAAEIIGVFLDTAGPTGR